MTRKVPSVVIVGGGALPERLWGVHELRAALHEAREHQASTMRIVDLVREALNGDTSPDDTTIQGKAARILRERDAALAALDEARRERDEKVAWAADLSRALAEALRQHVDVSTRLEEAQDEAAALHKQLAEAQAHTDVAHETMVNVGKKVEAHLTRERDEARQALAALLDAHASPSDATRIAGHRAAMETRRGWGM